MRVLKWIGLTVLLGFAAMVAVLFFNLQRLPKPDGSGEAVALRDVDADKVARNLSAAIQYKTVIPQDASQTDYAQFDGFGTWMGETFPEFHAVMQTEMMAGYTPMHRWIGSNPSLPPVVFLAHQDVVPASETDPEWDHPPFAGVIDNGVIYGRGALDDKGSLVSILEASNDLAAQGWRPERTLIFVFGHDEEVEGSGARLSAEKLRDEGISPYAVIDEGGAIITGFNGMADPVALVAVAEKGYFTARITATAQGGHSSSPPEYTAIGALSRAIAAIEANPFEQGLNEVTAGTLKALAPSQDFVSRLAIANLWLFGGQVEAKMAAEDSTRTLLGTSIAPTIIQGGFKENALAREATALVNFRIHPRDTQDSVLAHLNRVVNDPAITIEPASEFISRPSPVSPIGEGPWNLIEGVIQDVNPGMIVAPNMLAGGTDSRYFSIVTDKIYRFMPIEFGIEELGAIHGLNEKVSVDSYGRSVAIYDLLIQRAGSADLP